MNSQEDTVREQDDLVALLEEDGGLVLDALDRWVDQAGDRAFLCYGEDDIVLSYSEFGRQTDALAGNLARLGVAKGERVSLFLRNPLITTIWMFGIWKAGAVFCPINFSYTGRLLTYQLNDTRPALLVTERSMLPALLEAHAELVDAPRIVVYDAPEGAHDHVPADRTVSVTGFTEIAYDEVLVPAERPAVEIQYDDVANVIYTSGTTGPSKGVVQCHRWMNQYTWFMRRPLTSEDIVYNDLPMYHVGGAMANVARAAWVGAGVSLWDRFSAGDFWQRIASSGATTAILLDVMIPWLMNPPASDTDRCNTLNKAHMQPLPLNHHAVARRFGIDFVTAGFGQTESGGPLMSVIEEVDEGEGTPADLYRGRSHAEMRQVAERNGAVVLRGEKVTRKGYMGRPAPFVEAVVLNDRDEPCGPDEAGELALRPKLPALFVQEYLGKPESTVRAFRNLWFHTGDAAVRDERGTFFFVDRLGDRIRRRGENISTFHVEDLMNQHEDVALSAAFPVPAEDGDEDEVVVFVQPESGRTIDLESMSAWLETAFPKFMRPQHVRVIDEIPRTPTNKIEKYRLKQRFLEEH
jgi:crotonobetaine/carnitine-CoA ligase